MVRLAEEVRQSEANVKSGISKVNHFVVEQNQFAAVHQSILRAEIAVDQTVFVIERLARERVEKFGCRSAFLGGIKVIRFQAEALEVGGIGEGFRDLRPGLRRLAVDGAKKQSELLEMVGNDLSRQQDGLPILVLLGYPDHAQKV